MTTSIATLVFFDLETTGLPTFEFNRTKITEITLVACSVEHIRKCSIATLPNKMPRVLHKLTVCLNPFRMIQPESSAITGLDNFMLEHQQTFNANTGELLVRFVRQLQQPVCLVAHNGDRFDFPLLRRELERIDVELPDDVRCVDSLTMFRKIEELETLARKATNETDVLEIESNTATTPISSTNSDLDLVGIIARESHIDWRKINETTPHQKMPNPSLSASSISRDPDVDQPIHTNSSTKRKLFDVETKTPPPKKRYRLSDIYERLFDVLPPQAHCAEEDTLALLRCVCAVRAPFLALVDGESRRFAEVLPLGQLHASATKRKTEQDC